MPPTPPASSASRGVASTAGGSSSVACGARRCALRCRREHEAQLHTGARRSQRHAVEPLPAPDRSPKRAREREPSARTRPRVRAALDEAGRRLDLDRRRAASREAPARRSVVARVESASPSSMRSKSPSASRRRARSHDAARTDRSALRRPSAPRQPARLTARPGSTRSATSVARGASCPLGRARRRSGRSRPRSRPSTVTPVTCSARPAPAADAEHRIRVAVRSGKRAVALERRSVEHGHERRQVLAHDDVERYLKCRLLPLAARKRRAIALGEQREPEREREERRPSRPSCRDRARARPQRAAPRAERDRGRRSRARADGTTRATTMAATRTTRPGRTSSRAAGPSAVASRSSSSGAAEERYADDEQRSGADELGRADAAPLSRPRASRPRRSTPSSGATRPSAMANPRGDATLRSRTAPAGAPASLAASPPATSRQSTRRRRRRPPRWRPSTTVSRPSCQRRAPDHVRRVRAASRSRRMPRAARTANASRSAAASPPTSSSRRELTVARRSAERSSSSGTLTENELDSATSAARARSTRPMTSSTSQSRGCPAASGQTHA